MIVSLQDIQIRTEVRASDQGHVVKLHGLLYRREFDYGIEFENYVAAGLNEFYSGYDVEKDCTWVCEYKKELAGFLLLLHRENNSAQLRYFIIKPEFRGIGLGKRLLDLYFEFLRSRHYKSAYLWTTADQLTAAALYTRYGFHLTKEVESAKFGKPVTEQRYDWVAGP